MVFSGDYNRPSYVMVMDVCAGSGMGAAAVFEWGDGVDELTNARGIPSHNWLSRDAM